MLLVLLFDSTGYNGIAYRLDRDIGIHVSFGIAELIQVYRFADIHTARHAVDERFTLWQRLETSVQRKRNDRQSQIAGYLESTAFEPSHFAVQRTGSLREDHGAYTAYQLFLHLFEALHRGFGIAAFDEDMSGGFTPRPYKRHLKITGSQP